MFEYTFTVFTPTYNRADSLRGVYESLKAQTFRDFEWLVVDDGSTDGTEALVEEWMENSGFPVRYLYQENSGKPRATNRAAREARGELFLTLDSDDRCVPEALERFKLHWDSIPETERDYFSAVTVNCVDPDGNLVGDPFPKSPIDSDPIEIHQVYGVRGEKWGFQRTDVMRKFPFPEFENEKHIAESVVWKKIGRNYKTRFVNESLRIYESHEEGLSASNLRLRAENPKGACFLYYQELVSGMNFVSRLRSAVNYMRFTFHGGLGLRNALRSKSHKSYILAAVIPAVTIYLSDLIRLGKKDPARADSKGSTLTGP